MTHGNEPAFAIPETQFSHVQVGLTKREYFAAMAMQGRMSLDKTDKESFELTALVSVQMADALVNALANHEPDTLADAIEQECLPR